MERRGRREEGGEKREEGEDGENLQKEGGSGLHASQTRHRSDILAGVFVLIMWAVGSIYSLFEPFRTIMKAWIPKEKGEMKCNTMKEQRKRRTYGCSRPYCGG